MPARASGCRLRGSAMWRLPWRISVGARLRLLLRRCLRCGEGVMTMAEADCELCRMMGYRSCDVCGNVVFPANLADSPKGRELCAYCLNDLGL